MAGARLINAVTRRQRPYRNNHPLAIPRTALAIDLIRAYEAVDEQELLPGRMAEVHELAWFHTDDYLGALQAAEERGSVHTSDRERYQLGTVENPYFDQLFSIPAHAAGGSIQAAEEVIAGRIAFNPAGGMHHARAGAARGFCYFNDPVLAILRLRHAGWRVLYLDIDAHHGDGVEEAFRDDPDVLTFSLHMDTAYAYPYRGGALGDEGSAAGRYTTVNIPLPQGTHDAEYQLLFNTVWFRALERFQPDAVVMQAGTDLLGRDPLGKLAVSTEWFLELARTVLQSAPRHSDGTPRLAVTGGGGYHPLLLARAWTGLWALLSGRELPTAIPEVGTRALRDSGWRTDEDAPYFDGLFRERLDFPEARPVRGEIRDLASALLRHPFLK